jgi:hypothetical protein
VIVAAAWLAGETRPAIAIRKALAPSLRDSPAIAYSVAGAVLLLIVLWGPTPAFRNFWWIVVFAVLLALGVTMLRRETAVEFPDLEPGQTLGSLRQQRAHVGARTTVTGDSTETGSMVEGSGVASATTPPGSARVDSLERLAALRDRGAITSDEYQAEKTLVLNHHI